CPRKIAIPPVHAVSAKTRLVRHTRRSHAPGVPGTGWAVLPSIALHLYCFSLYNLSMKTGSGLDQFVAPLGDCLTPESARRLLALKANPKLQARVDDLAARHSRGLLTPEEQAEYSGYVYFDTFLAILKSK